MSVRNRGRVCYCRTFHPVLGGSGVLGDVLGGVLGSVLGGVLGRVLGGVLGRVLGGVLDVS